MTATSSLANQPINLCTAQLLGNPSVGLLLGLEMRVIREPGPTLIYGELCVESMPFSVFVCMAIWASLLGLAGNGSGEMVFLAGVACIGLQRLDSALLR